MSDVDLKLDWCSFQAAKYAIQKWHYSHSMPGGKRVQIGVWEDGKFVGAIVYGYGINQFLGKMFGLKMIECVELCRVALAPFHQSETSRCVSISLKLLKKQSPGLRLVVSYADIDQGHHGGIYAAGNWVYMGATQLGGGTPKFLVNGKILHGRQVHSLWGKGSKRLEWLRKYKDPNAQKIYTKGKHKYLYPLDSAIRKQIEPLRKPYPKRQHADEAIENAADAQSDNGGATPTRPL